MNSDQQQAKMRAAADKWFAKTDFGGTVAATDGWEFAGTHRMLQANIYLENGDKPSIKKQLVMLFDPEFEVIHAVLDGKVIFHPNKDENENEDSQAFRDAAINKYVTGNGNVNVDSNAIVSQGEGGAYVAAWVWVSDKEAGIKNEDEDPLNPDTPLTAKQLRSMELNTPRKQP